MKTQKNANDYRSNTKHRVRNIKKGIQFIVLGLMTICFNVFASDDEQALIENGTVTEIHPVGSSERTYRVPNFRYINDYMEHINYGGPHPDADGVPKTIYVTQDLAEVWAAVNGMEFTWNGITFYFKENPVDPDSADLPVPSGNSHPGGGTVVLKAGTFNFGESFTPLCLEFMPPEEVCSSGDWVIIMRSVSIIGEGKRPHLQTTIKGGTIPFWTWGEREIDGAQAGPTVKISDLKFLENFALCVHTYDYANVYIDGCEFVDTHPSVEEFKVMVQVAAHSYGHLSVKNSFFKPHPENSRTNFEAGISFFGLAVALPGFVHEYGPVDQYGHAEVEFTNNEIHGTLKDPDVPPHPSFGGHVGLSCGEFTYNPALTKPARIESNTIEAEHGIFVVNKPAIVRHNNITVTKVVQEQPVPLPSGVGITAGLPSEDAFGFFTYPQNNSVFHGNKINLNDGRIGIWVIGNDNVLKANSIRGTGDYGIFIDHANGYVLQPDGNGNIDFINFFAFPFLRDSAGIRNVLVANNVNHFKGKAGVLFSPMAHDNIYEGNGGVVLEALDEDLTCGSAGCVNDPDCSENPSEPLYFEREWTETGFDPETQSPIFEYLPISCGSLTPKNNAITGVDKRIGRHWKSGGKNTVVQGVQMRKKWKAEGRPRLP